MELTWDEDAAYPEFDAERYQRLVARLNPFVRELQQLPLLAPVFARCLLILANNPGERAPYGFSTITVEDEIAVGLVAVFVERATDEELRFAFAHELAHALLGHSEQPDDVPHGREIDKDDEIAYYMLRRAVEPAVNDIVRYLDIPRPLVLTSKAPFSDEAFGFEPRGASTMDRWLFLDGQIGQDELARRASGRFEDAGWDNRVLSPSAAARRFWNEHRGPWQDGWEAELAALVTAEQQLSVPSASASGLDL